MIYCYNCKKLVNTTSISINVHITTITSYYCSECKLFIKSEITTKNKLLGDK